MSKQPQRYCPRCNEVLVRIYARGKEGVNSRPYIAIGHMCPVCREGMFVLDRVGV